MGFIPAIGSAIAAVPWGKIFGNEKVQEGLVKGGSALLGKALQGEGSAPPGVVEAQQRAAGLGLDVAGQLGPLASRTYAPAVDYWSRLLGGRQGAAATLAPEIERIRDAYRATTESTAALAPRGGGRSAFFTELPYRRARDVTNLLQTARPQAAQGLMQTGTGIYGNLLGALSAASGSASGLLNYGLQERAQEFKRGQEIGQGLFDILGQIPGIIGDIRKPSSSGLTGQPVY